MLRALLPAFIMVGAGFALASPSITPPAGMTRTHAGTEAPGSFALPVNTAGASEPTTKQRAGTVQSLAFRGEQPSTALGAVEAIAAPLAADGFETVLDCAATACGGFDFLRSIHVLRQPAMMANPLDFHQRTLRRLAPMNEAVWVSVLASRFAGQTHLQVVTVSVPPSGGATGQKTLPSTAEDKNATIDDAAPNVATQPAPINDPVAMMAQSLMQNGRVILRGIDFDSASANKGFASAEALDHVAAMLKARPDLAAVVVGHSDSVGDLSGNIALSQERAASVVEALEARGVAPGRLEPLGAGWLAPVAPNTSAEGRAANRRVEIVLR